MSKDYIVRGLNHIGIMTDKPEECAQFYIDNLGFRPYYTMQLGPMKLVFVELGGMVLEFVPSGARENHGIVDHIAIEVQGIEALVAELKAKGVAFEKDEVGVMPDFFPSGSKNIFFRGPAGERVELFDLSK